LQKRRQLFFKYCATFDSTPCNIVRAPISLPTGSGGLHGVCPPFPSEAHRLQAPVRFDQIISESPKRLDPLTPMRDPPGARTPAADRHRSPDPPRRFEPELGLSTRIEALKKDGVRYAIADGP